MTLKRKRGATDKSYYLISLQEEIRLEESALKALLEREALVHQKLVAQRLQVKRLLQQKLLWKERERERTLKAARSKHLSLEKELQESLQKSREKLSRLDKLEEEKKEQESLNDNKNDNKNDNTDHNDTDHDDDNTDHIDIDNQSETQDNPKALSVCLINMHTLQQLYHTRARPNYALQAFLPMMESSIIAKIMLLYMRDATAIDDSNAAAAALSDNQKEEGTIVIRSTSRRCLLWNTCLDLLLLLPPNSRNSCKPTTTTNETETEQTSAAVLDPNVSLCPYELAGICADQYCPYQHTNRGPTSIMLPRELLLLPNLQLGDHPHRHQTKRAKPVAAAHPQPPTQPPAQAQANKEKVVEMDSNDDHSEDENFISLPQNEEDEEPGTESEEEEDGDTGVVSAYLKETKINAFSFWWGEELYEEDILVLSSSITDVLRDIGGVNVELNHIQLRIPSSNSNSNTEGWIPWLGRMVDVCRISTHAGRHDIAHSILDKSFEEALLRSMVDGKEPTFPDSQNNDNGAVEKEKTLLALYENRMGHVVWQLHKIRRCAFSCDEMPSSPFHNQFAIQASYAILSAYVKARHQASATCTDIASFDYSHCPANKGLGPSVSDFAMDSINFLMNMKPISMVVEQTDPVEQLRKHLQRKEADMDANKAIRDFEDLNQIILWAKRTFRMRVSSAWFYRLSPMVLEDQLLKPCWVLVSASIWKSNEETRLWECLRGTIVMGFVILGCLEKFAAMVRHGEDSLNASLTAALTSLDSSIHRILKDLSNQVSDDSPLLNLILAPLVSASVATAAFLRLYSAAQNRLEAVLVKKRQTRSMWMQYSELLWSQLVHLRMSLPTGSNAEGEGNNAGVSGYGEPSTACHEDIQRLSDAIEKLGIKLHHISLLGDCNLVRTLDWSNRPSWEVEKLESVAKALPLMIFDEDCPEDLVERRTIDLSKIPLTYGRNDSRLDPSPLMISILPRSILLASSCAQLYLQQCQLSCLPPSFGLNLVNLIRLDLSRNFLDELPKSIKAMTSLQELILCHNQIRELPEVGGTELKSLYVSHNRLSQLPYFLTNRAKLEELDLSHNCLDNSNNKKDLFMSNLILILKQLRTLKLDPQYNGTN